MDLENTGLYSARAIDELQQRLFLPVVKEAVQETMAAQVTNIKPEQNQPLCLDQVFGSSAVDFVQQ